MPAALLSRYWWQPAFVLALLLIGLPYWWIPYRQLNLPDALLGPGLVVLAVLALAVRAWSGKGWWPVTLRLGAAVPAVVMLRVIFDVVRVPSSHNLWPFELVMALLLGGAVAGAGALLGSLLARVMHIGARDEP
jgi:hypothetical protein